MRKTIHDPSIAQDIGSLAGLYRTVFWMIGRKVQYGKVWPDEVYWATPRSMPEPPKAEVREEELVGSR